MTTTAVPLRITICGRAEAVRALAERQYDALISINDPEKRFNRWTEHRRTSFRRIMNERLNKDIINNACTDTSLYAPLRPSLFLWFWDTEDDESGAPQNYHIESIREFITDLPLGAAVLIHCKVGISRSTAAAIIALACRGMTRADAHAEVMRLRSIACPNQRMLALAFDAVDDDSVERSV